MNFKANYYMPLNIASDKWGKAGDNDSYTGLLGEAIAGNADFYLGDLHYTIHNLNYFDLSTPYNTECLTFLTPESLTDNSWKLLILPFRLNAWIALICTLLIGGGGLHVFALLYQKYIGLRARPKYDEANAYDSTKGLYLFTEFQNSMLYTYGGWNEESKEFFLASSDPHSQEIGNKFELIENEKDAIDGVANGTFCYYENSYLLRYIRGKRIFEEENDRKNKSKKDTESAVKYNLHIMEECVVYMPIALGLEKNSPLKPYVDLWVRRMTEIGLVRKWLSDVMEWSKINESQQKSESEAALVNLRKLYGALIALGIGYFLGFVALFSEIIHWRYVVLRDPKYDKYHLDIFYKKDNRSKT
ncbi:glutamate receptor delta-2 subunit-like protein [Lasius niger]|uniref:Glutamate receptor delta-2 subunit-like protein n=1 Tax=Lasius niger TaxID=67767 RepID=A0A0J7KKB3_LASNI|nr:glutamate receptor delta-2 subunit-like protein [Lasius niger]